MLTLQAADVAIAASDAAADMEHTVCQPQPVNCFPMEQLCHTNSYKLILAKCYISRCCVRCDVLCCAVCCVQEKKI